LIAALALVAALAGPGAAAGAPTKTRIRPEQRFAFVTARGTDGWRLQITAILASGKRARRQIGFFTRGPHHEEVAYLGPRGRATADGEIVGTLPGIGRVAVRFEQTSETPVTEVPERGCKAEGKGATLRGVFRGTIELHGEGGYTTIERRSAPGKIEVTPKEVCRRPKHDRRPPHETLEELNIEYLSAGRKESGGSLTFEAWGTGLKLPGGDPATDFSATYTHERGRVLVMASTRILGEEKDLFSLTAPDGTPTEATVNPPAPFSGTGTFKLESPTAASWTGDLSVDIPILGTVSLAEPGFWAGACAARCTETFPKGLRIGFLTGAS
jgi:hypothetical protein